MNSTDSPGAIDVIPSKATDLAKSLRSAALSSIRYPVMTAAALPVLVSSNQSGVPCGPEADITSVISKEA